MLKRLAAAAATAVLLIALPATAQADPKGEPFTLECGDVGTVVITTPPAEADWTPGLVTGSSQTFRPVAFGELTFTARDPEGNVVEEGSEPAKTKPGRIPPNADLVTCDINETFTEADGSSFTIMGTVTGFLTGR